MYHLLFSKLPVLFPKILQSQKESFHIHITYYIHIAYLPNFHA